ncbi:MAG: MoxR family ATPase [Pseudomonadota bacterium]
MTVNFTQDTEAPTAKDFETVSNELNKVREEVRRIIHGQDNVIDATLITLLCGGHALLVGLPGLGKTRLVESLGTILGLNARRVQFTPDLMPSDILGSEVLEENEKGGRAFRFIKGPIFAELLMADEINRASPRTQSALLQAMQERHVTIAGERHDLPAPFHVLATQNPLEQEGTYPLPEAQLDRFLMQVDITYPDLESEKRILFETTGLEDAVPKAVTNPQELIRAQKLVRRMPVGDEVVKALLKLVRSARPGEDSAGTMTGTILWGPGPRASQAFILAIRARALLDGRMAPSLDDVKALAEPILKHRMALSFAARAEGMNISSLIARLAEKLG